MHGHTAKMLYHVGIAKKDVDEGRALAWYVSGNPGEAKLYVQTREGAWIVAYDEGTSKDL